MASLRPLRRTGGVRTTAPKSRGARREGRRQTKQARLDLRGAPCLGPNYECWRGEARLSSGRPTAQNAPCPMLMPPAGSWPVERLFASELCYTGPLSAWAAQTKP